MRFILIMLMSILGLFSYAETQVVRQGNVFTQVSSKSSNNATQTKYTWEDSKGNKYPIFVTKNGRCFVNKVSAKTGKEYKYYLPEETCKIICKELGITYVPKQSKK